MSPPEPPAPGRAELTRRWSARHAGIVPSPLVSAWLRAVWALCRPLARAGVGPDPLTAAGVAAAVGAAAVSARRPRAAALLVAASAVCDGLDGGVAVVTDRASAHGAWLDRAADRICDAAFGHVLWQRGAPRPLAAAAVVLTLRHELGRTSTPRAGVVTVAERPSRVACTLVALLGTGRGPVRRRWVAPVCAAGWAVLELIAARQLRRP